MSNLTNNFRPSRTDALLFLMFMPMALGATVLYINDRDQAKELKEVRAQMADLRAKDGCAPVKFYLDGLEIPVQKKGAGR